MMSKVFDPEANMYRVVRVIKDASSVEELREPIWPAENYANAEKYYVALLQTTRDDAGDFNITLTDKFSQLQDDEVSDSVLFAFDDLLNRFINFWRSFEYLAEHPEESTIEAMKDSEGIRAVALSMVAMYRELGNLQESGDNLLLDTIRYFMRICVRRSEMEHPIRKLRHTPMETRMSHVLAIQSIDLFLLRMGIDILRVPFKELVDIGETDFEKEQFSAIIKNFNT